MSHYDKTTSPLWVHHFEAARSSLLSALGYERRCDFYRESPYRFANYSKRAAECLRPFLPYSIQKIDDDRVIFLNREYKPLGFIGLNTDRCFSSGGEWVNYDLFESAIADINSPKVQSFLKACGPDVGKRDWIWFAYDDITAPWYGRKQAEALLEKIHAALD